MKSILLLVLLLAAVLPAAAQSPTVEIRAAAEYRISSSDTPETGKSLALALARRNAIQEAAAQLRATADVKAIAIPPKVMDAILRGILDVEKEDERSERAGNETLHRARVKVILNVPVIVRRLDRIRHDSNAVASLMETGRQSEILYQQLAKQPLNPSERESLVRKLNVNRLLTSIYAGLAKTEESPASSRVASAQGRLRALQLSEMAIGADPDSQEAQIALGDALIQVQQPAAAAEQYRQALLLGPNSSRVHLKLAEAIRLEDNLPEAIAEVREAIRIDPNSAIAHNDLGFILTAGQNVADATSEYREAIRLDPDLIDAHNNLAITFARQGKMSEAAAEFRQIIRIDPSSVLGYYNLAIALADLEKDDESAEALRQALHFNPTHFNAHYNIGELLRLEGKLDEAVYQFREYLRLAPDTPQNQRNIRRAADFVKTHQNL